MPPITTIPEIARTVLAGNPIDRDQGLFLLRTAPEQRWDLFYWANRIREQRFGPEISFCSIAAARTGSCPEDCKFCSQSSRYPTAVAPQSADSSELLAAAESARKMGAHSFGIVASGRSPSQAEIEQIARVISITAEKHQMECCASLGSLTPQNAQRLYDLGVRRYNHNLETSRRFFPQIVTTHTYDDRIATVRAAQQAGLKVCCGGIIGLGETPQDRLDLAFTLRELDVDTIPLNFLDPIAATPLADQDPIKPLEALQVISLFRFVLPDKQIKIAGGREKCLRDLQSWMFYAGASSTMLGNYLTTVGRSAQDDFQMFTDLEIPTAPHPEA